MTQNFLAIRWRHRFKTVDMEARIPPRILDALQGQAARSVADTYGDVTVSNVAREIGKLPHESGTR